MDSAPIQDKLPALRDVFADCAHVLLAYLFGSVAEGRAHAFSDVDFAVLLAPDAPHGLDRFVVLDRLASSLADVLSVSERDVDVVSLGEAGLVFQHRVISTGQRLFERTPKARRLFEWRVICNYLDFKPTLDIYDRRCAAMRSAHGS